MRWMELLRWDGSRSIWMWKKRPRKNLFSFWRTSGKRDGEIINKEAQVNK